MTGKLIVACIICAGPVFANCVPPASTFFACTLRNGETRVEFCQGPVGGNGWPEYYTFNLADGISRSEVYFQTDTPWLSPKYYRGRDDRSSDTLGMALEHEGRFYTFYVTGVFGSPIRAAQLHIFDSQASFQSDEGEMEAQRYYCLPDTILIDWTHVGP